MVGVIGIGIGSDSFVSSLGNRSDIERVPAALHLAPDVPPVLGRRAEEAAQSLSGSDFRDFTSRVGDPVPVVGDRAAHTGAELVAVAIHCLVQDRLRGARAEVVVAYPSAWTDFSVGELSVELNRLGIRHRLVTEAEAAYVDSVDEDRILPGASVLLLDVGSGGADLSVVRSTDGDIQVTQPTHFDDFCGDLVDSLLVELILRGAAVAPDFDPRDRRNWSGIRALRARAGKAKELLSHDVSAVIDVELSGVRERRRVVRAELEELIDEPVRRIVQRVADVVARVDVPLDAVLLAGGSAAIPLLAERLSGAVALPIVACPEPADTVVRGAAIIAARIERPTRPDDGTPPEGEAVSEYDRPLFDAGPPAGAFRIVRVPAADTPATTSRRYGRGSRGWRGVPFRE